MSDNDDSCGYELTDPYPFWKGVAVVSFLLAALMLCVLCVAFAA